MKENGFIKVLCRIIPTDSIPENANFGLQCPNVKGIELFENVNFVNDRFTKLHYLTLKFRFYTHKKSLDLIRTEIALFYAKIQV